MKRMKRYLPRLSRPQRIIWNLFASLLLLLFIWWVFDCPLPLMARFRIAEKKMLVGPSEILAKVTCEDLEFGDFPAEFSGTWEGVTEEERLERAELPEEMKDAGTFVIGEADGVLVWYRGVGTLGGYGSVKKTGDVTLWKNRSYEFTTWKTEADPVYSTAAALILVRADIPGAVYASLEWRDYPDAWPDDRWTNWCSGSGTVQGDGVFVIPVFQSSEPVIDSEGINGRFDLAEAHLVLTDENGTVIYDEILIVE